MKNKLFKLFHYCSHLGWWRGLRILCKMSLARRGQVIAIGLPELAHPVFIRAKSSDEYAFRQIFVNKEYEFKPEMPITTVIDAGANIGLAAAYFVNQFPGCRIICLEPEPKNFELLQKNIAPYPTITGVQKGVWNKSTNLKIVDSGLGNWGFTVQEVEQEEPGVIKAVSLNDIMKQYNLDSLDIVKMDIEGSEKEVLEAGDASEWLSRCKILVIEIHDRMKKGTSAALFNKLLQYDTLVDMKGENLICTLKPLSETR
jgi:FkbM family methyltransferase